jgi:hypothetical protein
MFTTLFASYRSQTAQPRAKARTVALGMEELEDRLTPSHGGLGHHHGHVAHHHARGHHAPARVAPMPSQVTPAANNSTATTGTTVSVPTKPAVTSQAAFDLTGTDLALDIGGPGAGHSLSFAHESSDGQGRYDYTGEWCGEACYGKLSYQSDGAHFTCYSDGWYMTGVISGSAGNYHMESECTPPSGSEFHCKGDQGHTTTSTQQPTTTTTTQQPTTTTTTPTNGNPGPIFVGPR